LTKVIKKIKDKIKVLNFELDGRCSIRPDDEIKGRISGLEEALHILESAIGDSLVCRKKYFVVMYRGNNKNLPYVEEMLLYKISKKKKSSYCFCEMYESGEPSYRPDLVLGNRGIATRVFVTRRDAEKQISA